MRKAFQAVLLMLLLLISTVSGGAVHAQEEPISAGYAAESYDFGAELRGAGEKIWPSQRIVGKNKEWTVRFSEELDPGTINDKNISVINGANAVQKIDLSNPSKDLVIKPKSVWEDGSYTLVIKDLRSKSGKPLKYSYRMKFEVRETCPIGQIPWKSSAAVYPKFTISGLKNTEGSTLELGSLVADASGKLIGRVIEIKEIATGYEISMDKKCVGGDPAPNNSGKRRMYSFNGLRPGQKNFTIKGKESSAELLGSDEYGGGTLRGSDYGNNVQPGDAIYTPGTASQEQQNFVGFVDEVDPQPDGSIDVILEEEEPDPVPYVPAPADINPPPAPIGTPEELRTIDGHMHHTVFISGQKLYSMGQSPASRSLVPEQVNTGDYALIKQVAADSQSALVLTVDGTVHRYVQGTGWIKIEEDNKKFDGKRFIQVASGQDFYLVLTNKGEVWRHGNNEYFGAEEEQEIEMSQEEGLRQMKIEENPENAAVDSLQEKSAETENLSAGSLQQEGAFAGEEKREESLAEDTEGELTVDELRAGSEMELLTIGTGSRPTQNPVQLPGRAKQIDAVGKVALAVLENGDLYMWGNNYNGQADPTQPGMGQAIQTPKQVMFSGGSIKMAQTDGDRTVVLTSGGEVYFWGKNWSGLGNKGISKIDGLSDIVKIAVKKQHMLALRKDGAVFSIGANEFGELGIGNTRPYKNEEVFKLDFNGAIIKDIGVGDNTSYAIDTKNQLWVWGDNIKGQLGLGTRGEKARVIVPVLARTLEDYDFVVIN